MYVRNNWKNIKSHRLQGGCYKWWRIACYLRANLGELMLFSERIQSIISIGQKVS